MPSPAEATSSACAACAKRFGIFARAYTCPTPADGGASGCGRKFCWACINFACITEAEGARVLPDFKSARITSFCKECFRKQSPLGYGSSDPTLADGVEVFAPPEGVAAKDATIMFAHGGGGCRLMFKPHAEHFAKLGYRTVIFDLPGHGVLADSPLSLETAQQLVADVVAKYGSGKTLYVGGSLGGYLGMELVGKRPDLIDAAVIAMAGQNVGKGASFAARAGLFFLGGVSGNISSASLLSAMRSAAASNGHLDPKILMDTSLRPGFFFEQNEAQITMLKQSDPGSSLPKFKGPILFVNGSKDHRDSEGRWLELSNGANGGKSKLIVYEGADHFFSHDIRYFQRFLKDMEEFFNSV